MVRRKEGPMDERMLVKRARRGDIDAFALLVQRHERAMYAVARGTLHSEWDAADAVQEAFTEAFEHLSQLRDAERFKPWLARIVVNKCHEVYRRSSRLVLVDEPPETVVRSEGVSCEETLDLIRAVQRLDDDHRNTVALRYFCDLKLDDIAEVLDCPVGTVKSRLNRALTKLHMMLGADLASRSGDEIVEVAR
jgi:RNA polymerase sigma-70 factor, ECF subfamily